MPSKRLSLSPVCMHVGICQLLHTHASTLDVDAALQVGWQRPVNLFGVGQSQVGHERHKLLPALCQARVVRLLLANGAAGAALRMKNMKREVGSQDL
jgi:hypothetical protein